jgi:hypothetical protein
LAEDRFGAEPTFSRSLEHLVHTLGCCKRLVGSSRSKPVGADHDRSRLPMARDGDLFPDLDSVEDLGKKGAGFADRHRLGHGQNCTAPYDDVHEASAGRCWGARGARRRLDTIDST